MNKKEDYRAKQVESSQVLEEIKSVDTSKYKSNPMVEKLLVYQVEELRNKVETLESELATKLRENSALKVKVATLMERSHSEKIFGWIRNFVGIGLGISGSLIFFKEALLSKIGLILTPIFAVLFLLSCIFSFSRKENNE